MTAQATILHATCVAVDGRGLLILGPSGSGKSALALRLLALGARLVADDRTEVTLAGGAVHARCPAPIRGLIEARGVGLLRAEALEEVALALVADLGEVETERLPPERRITILGMPLALVHPPPDRHFAEALLLYLRFGRQD